MDFSVGDIVTLTIAAVSMAVYVNKLVAEAKKDTCQEIDKRFILLEAKYKELDTNLESFFSRYIARGERIKNAFNSIRESHVTHKHFSESLSRALFDLSQDLKDIYRKQGLVPRAKSLNNYEDFKKKISVDFDTLEELSSILEDPKE